VLKAALFAIIIKLEKRKEKKRKEKNARKTE
jgi:hypothetical protein